MRKEKNDSGYTLVELIIVIAIIAIMSGMAMVTISSIRTAQATTAMQRFDDELSALEMRTKTQSKQEAIEVVRDDHDYKIYYGTLDDSGTFTRKDSDADAVLQRTTIYYSSTYDADTDGSEVTGSCIISIRKSDGKVTNGAGQYKFVKYNTTISVGRVTLNEASGSHTYGKD